MSKRKSVIREDEWRKELDRVLKPVENTMRVPWSRRELVIIKECVARGVRANHAIQVLAKMGFRRTREAVNNKYRTVSQ